MKTPEDLRFILTIVNELRQRGTKYAESIGDFEWKKRGWPADKTTFDTINALLRTHRELQNFQGKYKIEISNE